MTKSDPKNESKFISIGDRDFFSLFDKNFKTKNLLSKKLDIPEMTKVDNMKMLFVIKSLKKIFIKVCPQYGEKIIFFIKFESVISQDSIDPMQNSLL